LWRQQNKPSQIIARPGSPKETEAERMMGLEGLFISPSAEPNTQFGQISSSTN